MAGKEWEVAFISDVVTGETIADFTDRPSAERPVIGAGETAEITWGADGVFRLLLPGGDLEVAPRDGREHRAVGVAVGVLGDHVHVRPAVIPGALHLGAEVVLPRRGGQLAVGPGAGHGRGQAVQLRAGVEPGAVRREG